LVGALLATSGLSFATKELAAKEKKGCPTCHVKAGQKDLNDVGKYYKEKKTLEGAPKK
jgi:cytochrome c551/c552